MLLVLHLPTGTDFSAPCDWLLVDKDGHTLRAGSDTLDALPAAERVWAIVPASRVLFTELKLPPVSPSRLDELLPFAIEDKLMSDPATIVAVAGPAVAREERVVAVTERAWLLAALNTLQRVGITPHAVVPESELVAREPGCWTAVIPPQQRAGFLVRDDGFAVAFDLTSGGGAPLGLQLPIKEALARGAGPARLRLQSTEAVDEGWAAQLGLPVELHRSALLPVTPRAFNFLTAPTLRSFARRSGLGELLPLLKPAAILVALIVATHLVLLAFDVWTLQRQRQALEAEMVATFKTAFPDAKAIVDPALQLARNLDTLKRERGLAADPFVTAIASVTPALEAQGVRVRSATYSAAALVLELEAEQPEVLQRIAIPGARSEVLPGTPTRARLTLTRSAP